MAENVHEAAPHHLPAFITAPGETDWLFVAIACILIAAVLAIGLFYFKLHALPERMAHRSQSTQLQLVGVLALLALFTHNNIFWVAALLIAALRIPDIVSPLRSLARSAADIAARLPTGGGIRDAGVAAADPPSDRTGGDPRILASDDHPRSLRERSAG